MNTEIFCTIDGAKKAKGVNVPTFLMNDGDVFEL